MPGTWTLTTTRVPSSSVAACTCASEAAASGASSKSPNTLPIVPTELGLDPRADRRGVDGRNIILQLRELARPDRADEIRPARRELAELRDATAQLRRDRRRAAREIAMIVVAQTGLASRRGSEPQPAMAREDRGTGLRELAPCVASRATASPPDRARCPRMPARRASPIRGRARDRARTHRAACRGA